MTLVQLQSVWLRNGGSPTWAPFMAGVALSESSGIPTNEYNTTTHTASTTKGARGATGLWQLEWPLYRGLVPGADSRAALQTPDVNAQAAVKLFKTGAGLSNWKGDPFVNAWTAAGSPAKPNAATVEAILKSAGLSTGKATPGMGVQGTRTTGKGPSTKGTSPCVVSIPSPFPSAGQVESALSLGFAGTTKGGSAWCILNRSQFKAWKGATLIVVGGFVGVMGFLLLASSGFGSPKAARAASKLGSILPGPAKKVTGAKGATGATSRSTARLPTVRPSIASGPSAGRSRLPKPRVVTPDDELFNSLSPSHKARITRENKEQDRPFSEADRTPARAKSPTRPLKVA